MSKPKHSKSTIGVGLSVEVRGNNIESAIKALKRKVQREGVFREVKDRQSFTSKTQQRQIAEALAVKRDFKKAVKGLVSEDFTKEEAKAHLLKIGRSPR